MACEHCKGEHWNLASRFPTPGIPLVVKLTDGGVTTAIRPRYVSSYDVDPGYLSETKEPLVVEAWQYK